jgi:hypothetical protein
MEMEVQLLYILVYYIGKRRIKIYNLSRSESINHKMLFGALNVIIMAVPYFD